MNFKRLFLLGVTVIIAAGSCFGCGSSKYEQYDSVVLDSANDSLGIKSESNYWTGEYFVKKNMSSASCEAMGSTYSGKYIKSIRDFLNSYTTDIYEDDNQIEFGLRSDTGELVYINFMNNQFFDTEPFLKELDSAQEKAEALSEKVAANYVNNLNDYERIIHDSVTRHKEKDGETYSITYFNITFAKKIGEVQTSDYISIKTTSKGNVASIYIGDLNAFSNIKESDFDIGLAEQSVKSKIDSVYQKVNLTVTKTEFDDRKIARTPNGEICLCSYLNVTVENENKAVTETGVKIMTILGHD